MTMPILLLLALLGAPLFAVIGASALIGFYREEIDLAVVAIEIWRLTEVPVLLAIPLFTLAGYLLGESKAPSRLVAMSQLVVGWLPGGLAMVAFISCALFTAFTGASGVTIVALGAVLVPAMLQAGYRERFTLGLVTSSGSLGVLFAPSLPLILYGVVAQQVSQKQPVAIDDLFLAGILPGCLMILLLGLYSMWQPRTLQPQTTDGQSVRAVLRDAAWEIPLPFVILGGIYGGFLVVSEAAVVTLVYVFIVEVLIKREVPFSQLPRIMRESMVMVGGILIILGVSLASTNYLIDTDVPTEIFEFIQGYMDSKWTFLIALNIFLLLLGMMLDIFSAIVILIPIVLPIALEYGVDPVHLGIIFLANMQLGYFTPPVGMNLFIASYRFDKPVMMLYRATIPFFFILLAAVLIITYVPALSLMLVR